MRNWAISALLSVLAVPVWATPPRFVDIEDRLFARTDDRIYILRHLTDNHGTHFVLQTDIALVAVSLETGRELSVEPVTRVIDYGPDEPERVQLVWDDQVEPAQPFTLFSDGARPLAEPLVATSFVDAELGPQGLRAVWSDGAVLNVWHMSSADMQVRIQHAIEETAASFPETDIGICTNCRPLSSDAFSDLGDCTVNETAILRLFDVDRLLVPLRCSDADDLNRLRLWIVLERDD